jgi:hypothetical protein
MFEAYFSLGATLRFVRARSLGSFCFHGWPPLARDPLAFFRESFVERQTAESGIS